MSPKYNAVSRSITEKQYRIAGNGAEGSSKQCEISFLKEFIRISRNLFAN
jgi:hypothetical protein